MALKVRCERDEPAALYLHHLSVDGLPVMIDLRPGSPFHNAVRITVGWGLDLNRPDHLGATSYWKPRTCGKGCVRSVFPNRIIESMKANYTVHVRFEIKDSEEVDARFDLSRSRQRIEDLCDHG